MSVTSEAAICNVALVRVGETQLIDNLDQTSASARTCKAIYGITRDKLLEAHWWTWATGRAVLARLVVQNRPEWTYAYAAPVNMLVPRFVHPNDGLEPKDEGVPFITEPRDDQGAMMILTGMESASLLYTRSDVPPVRHTGHFNEALALALAVKLAAGLPKKHQLAASLRNEAAFALAEAKANDANTIQRATPARLPDMLRVRG